MFERDGWRCHICGQKVNRKAKAPHPKAATIDHVIPLARGGTHEPINCRCAHFLCNALKRDTGCGDQLLLIA
ncbi:HNH endonuclease signature motif containing protein [Rhodococcus sp. AH-ZY2]|uniref:HNH endonuclease n=1 Tax=Rhodococcus sp. AH-ZY2 TaxID=3047468 RepID=UPI0027E0BD95|nr:HNH endonuclease signature motif containing protein [Rhodococcus sp. AH-ZY2]WML63644.1 HNH endonuclease signature motif containing protein [Rhodococcus sp. AH-ZY2]